MIVVDSREQKPYWSGKYCFKTALCVGDYSTVELLNVFHIERKSLQDLCGTVANSKNHLRFKKEFMRAREQGIKLVVYVEGTRDQLLHLDFPGGDRRQIKGETLIKIVNTMTDRYATEFNFVRGREACMDAVEKRLRMEEKKYKSLQNGKSVRKS